MTIKDAIKQMMDFYRAVEAASSKKVEGVLTEASDAVEELEKMQDVGVDCRHCKFYNAPDCNACRECMFFRLTPTDQKRPLNYEPI